MTTRQQKRAAARTEKKIEGRPKVYLSVPEDFRDVAGEPWRLSREGTPIDLDLSELLLFTVRQAPVKTGNDAFRSLDIYNSIKDTPDGVIEMTRDDWDWMIAHFKEMAHTVWKAPDAAYLVRWLEANVQQSPPKIEG